MTDSPAHQPSKETPASEPPRRSFLYHAMTIVVSSVIGLAPLVSGLAVFFDPLRRRAKAGASADESNWLRIATLDAVPQDGIPRQFPVIADQVDAWNRIPDQPVGLLYLRREPGSQTVEALNAVCPHAGCFVALVDKGDEKQFRCPCHTSAFSLEGGKLNVAGVTNPSPRDMDPLEVDQEKLAATGEIWVDFKNFYPGKHERVEKA